MRSLREEIRVCEEDIKNSKDEKEVNEKKQLLEWLKELESIDISEEE